MLKYLVSFLLVGFLTVTSAGYALANDPGTVVHACFKFQNLPSTSDPKQSVDYMFNFDVAGASAFDSQGKTSASFSFDDKDPSAFAAPDVASHCTSLGYYECDKTSCNMTLSYTVSVPSGFTPATPYAGTISLMWWSDSNDTNYVEGSAASTADTPVVCGSSVPCTGTEYKWAQGTVGQMYVIFQPSGS